MSPTEETWGTRVSCSSAWGTRVGSGAKAREFLEHFTARLKSRLDTKRALSRCPMSPTEETWGTPVSCGPTSARNGGTWGTRLLCLGIGASGGVFEDEAEAGAIGQAAAEAVQRVQGGVAAGFIGARGEQHQVRRLGEIDGIRVDGSRAVDDNEGELASPAIEQ